MPERMPDRISIYIYMPTRMPVDRGHSRKVILTIIVYQAGVYPFHSIRPSVHPSYPSTHTVHPSILSVHLHMAVNQNCVWNAPRCSGRMERRSFVTGLVPDLWSVMKYKLYINKYITYTYIYMCVYTVYIYIYI